jgi:Flp pilus assembly pilin Flp
MEKYIRGILRLSSDRQGVVAFEYTIVAATVVAAVVTTFGTGGLVGTTLTNAVTAIGTAVTAAIGG